MRLNRLNIILFCSLLTCACTPKPTDDKPHGVLTDSQEQTLAKAKQTEELMNRASKERMKDLDDTGSEN